MAIKKFKPTSSGKRFLTVLVEKELSSGKPYKILTKGLKKHAGRDSKGLTSIRHRGGGHKRKYRIIDFKRDKFDIPAKVQSLEYDPNRTANIALLSYADGEKRYILAPDGLKVGQTVISSEKADILPGNCLSLKEIPTGTNIHNIELKKGRGGQVVRSAGTAAQIMAKEGNYAQVKMPSNEVRKIHMDCKATIGQVGNLEHENISLGKAGRRRWMGRRPSVRGVAMNPVDHPMGGGEGKSSGGRHPSTPWGVPTKGLKTRRNRRTGKYIIKRRK